MNRDTHNDQLALLQTVIDALPHPVLIKDAEGCYVCSNAACDAIMGGLTRESFRGKKLQDLPNIDEEHRRLFETEHQAAIDSTELRTRRISLTLPDGQRRDMLYALRRIHLPDGGAPGILTSLVDVSEAIEAAHRAEAAEALLRQLTESLPVSVFQYVISPDGVPRTTYATRRAYDLFGLDPDECMKNIGYVFETLLPEYQEMMLSRIGQKKFEDISRPFEFQMQDRRDGRIRWVHSESIPERLTDGTIVCDGYWADITERKMLEADLLHAKEVAESASRIKAAFLANMSHEIRTPMNAILGMACLALKGDIPAKERSYVEKMQTAAKALLGIIDDILDSSKIEAGKLALKLTPMDIREVVDQVISISDIRADENRLALTSHIDPRIPGLLRGDPLRLGQVLTNLVGNAVKFTEHGEIAILVELAGKAGDHCDVKFSVKDTGIGMTSEQCAQLFQAFTQMDESAVHGFGGTGLGLLISKELVELMGGEIQVSSVYRNGSTFSFTLRLLVEADASSAVQTTADEDEVVPPDFGGCKVLVAEDNEFNQVIIRELLTDANIDPLIVDNGRAAIEALHGAGGDKIVLVLMDLQLPDMDGYEATQCLRAEPRFASLPIVAMTAHAMSEQRSHCFRIGMNDYISKPIDPDALYSLLSKWIFPSSTPVLDEVSPKYLSSR